MRSLLSARRLLAVLVFAAITLGALGASSGDTLFVTPPTPPKVVAPSWTGVWKTTYGRMVLEVTPPRATGSYVYGAKAVHGRIEGTADGPRISFAWVEKDGAGNGRGVFTLEPDGRHFKGTWGMGDAEAGSGEWTGEKE